LFKWINGPAGLQLGTTSESIPRQLGPADYEVGVIAGDRSINSILSMLISGPNDGKVSVESAKLAGMKDFLVVYAAHPFIMKNREVMRQTVAFLKNGEFYHTGVIQTIHQMPGHEGLAEYVDDNDSEAPYRLKLPTSSSREPSPSKKNIDRNHYGRTAGQLNPWDK
jgi:hypothetical protein